MPNIRNPEMADATGDCGVNAEGPCAAASDQRTEAKDVRFVWFHETALIAKRGEWTTARLLYEASQNWDDYRRLKKQPWPEGKKNTVVREDLIHDVQRGLLNFSFDSRDKPEEEEIICDEMLVEGDEVGSIHRVLLARPNLESPEDCQVFRLWERLKIPDLSANELRSLATARLCSRPHC